MSGESILSEREREILRLVAEGLTNREIAQKLSISHNTVKVHISNIFGKTGVSSRTEATLYAIEQRIVDVPGGEEPADKAYIGFSQFTFQSIWVLGVALFLIVFLGLIIWGRLFSLQLSSETVNSNNQSERWHELAPLTEERENMATVAYSGEIFVIAGEGPEGVDGKGFRYQPDLDEWISIAVKPTPVTDIRAVVIGEKIYIPGGQLANGQTTDVLEIYDPRQDSWEDGTPLPGAVSAYALADFEGQIYLFGGWDGQNATESVWIYDPEADTWQSGTPMSSARQGLSAVALMDRIVVLGGRNKSGLLATVQSYYPSRDANGEDPWSDFVDLPDGRANFDAASSNDTIYVVGGEGGKADTVLPSLQLISGQWVSLDNSFERIKGEYILDLEPMGSSLYVISNDINEEETKFWQFQAIYYEIYLPYVD